MTQTHHLSEVPRQLELTSAFGIGLCVLLQSAASVFSRLAGLFSQGGEPSLLVLNPWYIAMLAALVLQALCWPLVLRRVPLSVAYPCMGLVFPLNLFFAWWGLQEPVGWGHIMGTTLILAGVGVVLREDAAP